MEDIEKAMNTNQEELFTLHTKLGPISEEDFMNYTKRKVNCAFEMLNKLFNEDNDIVQTNTALSACKVFDILFLCTRPSIANLTVMIDDLSCFNFPEFTDDFLKNMKAELPSLMDLAITYEFDFDTEDEESIKYKNSRARRAKKRAIMFEVERHLHTNEDEVPHNIEEELNYVDQIMIEMDNNDYRVMD